MISNHQIFYINSANRETGTDSSFTYFLPIDVQAKYDSVCCLACSIPKSYYMIQATQNTMILSENGLTATITIPAGNYSYLSFKSVLPPLLNAASVSMGHAYSYTINYPNKLITADTGMFTYSVTNNGGVQPQFIFTSYLYEQFGFIANSTNIFNSNTLTSTAVINFTPETTLFIHSDLADNKIDDILQDVFDNNSPPYSYVVYYNQGNLEPYCKKLRLNDSKLFRFSLTNENNSLIELNNRNMLITAVCFRKDDTNIVQRELAKLHLLQQH